MSNMDNVPINFNISEEAQDLLDTFWTRHTQSIRNTTTADFKTQELPLARIKKIMKLDDDVKMIAAEAPVLFAKAVEIFIAELSLRAWVNTENHKRRTLQRNDIAMAIAKHDQFDFLIDIVPREEARPMKKDDNCLSALDPYNNYYIQALPPGTQLLHASNQSPPFSMSPQIIQVPVPSSSQNNRENRSQVSSPVPPLPIALSSQQYQELLQNHQRQNSLVGSNQQQILLNQPSSFSLSTNSGQVLQTIITTSSSKITSNSTKVLNPANKKLL